MIVGELPRALCKESVVVGEVKGTRKESALLWNAANVANRSSVAGVDVDNVW